MNNRSTQSQIKLLHYKIYSPLHIQLVPFPFISLYFTHMTVVVHLKIEASRTGSHVAWSIEPRQLAALGSCVRSVRERRVGSRCSTESITVAAKSRDCHAKTRALVQLRYTSDVVQFLWRKTPSECPWGGNEAPFPSEARWHLSLSLSLSSLSLSFVSAFQSDRSR